jgi:hypothetical protein
MKEMNMKHFLFLLLFAFSGVLADGIIWSADSLRICNSLIFRKSDSLVLTNNASLTIFLDSAYVLVDQLDTSELTAPLGLFNFETYWVEYTLEFIHRGDFLWSMETIDKSKFKLVKKDYNPANAQPISLMPEEKLRMNDLTIGVNPFGEYRPVYPKYLRGKLRLFFSNAQIVDIILYTNDLRTPIISNSKNVRKIPVRAQKCSFLVNGKYIRNLGDRNRNKVHNIVVNSKW